MNQRLHHDWHVAHFPSTTPSGKIFLVGLIGGLVGTIIMDVFGAGIFVLLGGPASLSFSVIGDAAASFLARERSCATGCIERLQTQTNP